MFSPKRERKKERENYSTIFCSVAHSIFHLTQYLFSLLQRPMNSFTFHWLHFSKTILYNSIACTSSKWLLDLFNFFQNIPNHPMKYEQCVCSVVPYVCDISLHNSLSPLLVSSWNEKNCTNPNETYYGINEAIESICIQIDRIDHHLVTKTHQTWNKALDFIRLHMKREYAHNIGTTEKREREKQWAILFTHGLATIDSIAHCWIYYEFIFELLMYFVCVCLLFLFASVIICNSSKLNMKYLPVNSNKNGTWWFLVRSIGIHSEEKKLVQKITFYSYK